MTVVVRSRSTCPPTTPTEVVFAGDGPWLSSWGRIVESTVRQSTMIVAVHGLSDEMSRLGEYSPVVDANRFAAHEQFFVEDVRRWVRSRFGVSLPAGRTAVFGYSAGGELAIALGLRHPDVYGVVLAGSPGGGYRPVSKLPRQLPRVYFFAGTREPFFLDNASRWAVALRKAGADVTMKERNTSHGADDWQADFSHMLTWAFGTS
ncbi:MAG TPA: alpha/beta hydrolase-fold protein [Acidimicrobiales bacterium]|nr:alpha/beta hydrolase-fold protein [Acidimicrobiales bacterium]